MKKWLLLLLIGNSLFSMNIDPELRKAVSNYQVKKVKRLLANMPKLKSEQERYLRTSLEAERKYLARLPHLSNDPWAVGLMCCGIGIASIPIMFIAAAKLRAIYNKYPKAHKPIKYGLATIGSISAVALSIYGSLLGYELLKDKWIYDIKRIVYDHSES